MEADRKQFTDRIIERAIHFDVLCGVARRAWGGSPSALETIRQRKKEKNSITCPYVGEDEVLERFLETK